MNRIELVREAVDEILLRMADAQERRCGYLHLYGVSQACALIALKRNENAELLTVAGMLHDISSYQTMETRGHAKKSAVMAREMLTALRCFSGEEMDAICGAIRNHSSKGGKFSAFDEVLIDADVLQHCLYNPLFEVAEKEKSRFEKLRLELGLPSHTIHGGSSVKST